VKQRKPSLIAVVVVVEIGMWFLAFHMLGRFHAPFWAWMLTVLWLSISIPLLGTFLEGSLLGEFDDGKPTIYLIVLNSIMVILILLWPITFLAVIRKKRKQKRQEEHDQTSEAD